MPRVKQASKQKRTTKAAAVTVLGATGLGFSLLGSASASTVPTIGTCLLRGCKSVCDDIFNKTPIANAENTIDEPP